MGYFSEFLKRDATLTWWTIFSKAENIPFSKVNPLLEMFKWANKIFHCINSKNFKMAIHSNICEGKVRYCGASGRWHFSWLKARTLDSNCFLKSMLFRPSALSPSVQYCSSLVALVLVGENKPSRAIERERSPWCLACSFKPASLFSLQNTPLLSKPRDLQRKTNFQAEFC